MTPSFAHPCSHIDGTAFSNLKRSGNSGSARYDHAIRNRPHPMSLITQAFTRRRWTLDNVASYLLFVSSLYLAIPHLIFYFGWLKWPLALLAAASLCVGLWATARYVLEYITEREAATEVESETVAIAEGEVATEVTPPPVKRKKKEFIFTRDHAVMIGAVALIWLMVAGVGGFVAQDNDWDKHNTVLNSLILKPWPTIYEIYKIDVPLVYYIAYYLPAALVGKVTGWYWANIALFGWSLAGLMIALLWFCILVRRASYSVLLIFVFFSGLDYIGKWVATEFHMWNANKTGWYHIDAWTGTWQYSSNATLMNWVPPQALAGWIVAGMTIYCLVKVRRRDLVLLPFGLSVFWSPFITMGIVPYLVLDFLIDKEPLLQRIRRMFTIPNIAGGMALAITGFYYSSKVYDISPIVIQSFYSGFALDHYGGPPYTGIIFLLYFCLLEFGLYAIILYRSGAVRDERWRWMFDITVLTLLILPWFKLGVFNDLVMRASIPALFVMAVLVATAIHDNRLSQSTHIALIVLLGIGAVTALVEFRRHVDRMVQLPAPLYDDSDMPKDFMAYLAEEAFFVGQYAGSMESPFYRYAARPHVDGARDGAGSEEATLNSHDYLLYGQHVFLLRDKLAAPPEVDAGSTFTVPWQLHFFGPSLNGKWVDPTLRFVDDEGMPVWETKSWPEGRPVVRPFAMTDWSGVMSVTVPITATPGLYSLHVGFSEVGTEGYLEAHSVPENEPTGEVVSVATVEVLPPE